MAVDKITNMNQTELPNQNRSDTSKDGDSSRDGELKHVETTDMLHPEQPSTEVCGIAVSEERDGDIHVTIPSSVCSFVGGIASVVVPSWVEKARSLLRSEDDSATGHVDATDRPSFEERSSFTQDDVVPNVVDSDDGDDGNNGDEEDDGVDVAEGNDSEQKSASSGSDDGETDNTEENVVDDVTEQSEVTICENKHGNGKALYLGAKMLESIGVAEDDSLRCIVDGDTVIYTSKDSKRVCDGARGVKNKEYTNYIKQPYDVFEVGDDVSRMVFDDRIEVTAVEGDGDGNGGNNRSTPPMKQKTMENITDGGVIDDYCDDIVEYLDVNNIPPDNFGFRSSVVQYLAENRNQEPKLPKYTSPSAVESIVCSRLND